MELLVRVVNQPSNNREEHCKRAHRGDVISAKPDGWDWTDRELSAPQWRILKMPTLLQAEADALLSSELDPTGSKAFRWTKRRRGLYFNKQALPYKFLRYLRDSTRQLSSYHIGQAGEDRLIRDLATDKGDANTVTAIYLDRPIENIDVVVGVEYPIDIGDNFLGSSNPFTYQFSAGTLPPGLTFSDTTGMITGIPTRGGAYRNNRVRGFDASGNQFGSNTFRIRVMTQFQYDRLYP
tara:strand:- start:1057 stop:1767 length:711 start_codon:yes stop_codon:yes gene_type:complete